LSRHRYCKRSSKEAKLSRCNSAEMMHQQFNKLQITA